MLNNKPLKDPNLVNLSKLYRGLFDFSSYKDSYFSAIKEYYNFVKDVDNYEATVFCNNGYNFRSQSLTIKDFYENKKDLFSIADKLEKKMQELEHPGFRTGDKDIFERLLDTHTMSEIEDLFMPLSHSSFEWFNTSMRDLLFESEIPEDIKEIESYLDSRKFLKLEAEVGADIAMPRGFNTWVVMKGGYNFIDSGKTHLDAFKDRDCLYTKLDPFYMMQANYVRYCYPFLVEKYYKKDLSSLNLENHNYVRMLVYSKIIDVGEFSRYIVEKLISPNSSDKDEKIAFKYLREIDFNLVDKSSLKKINKDFIKKYSLEETIYTVDPSLFLDELLDCKNNTKLRLLAVGLVPRGDARLNRLINEKTYSVLLKLIEKIPADKLPFMLGTIKGKHKDELGRSIVERMKEEEAIIKYMKRINSDSCE